MKRHNGKPMAGKLLGIAVLAGALALGVAFRDLQAEWRTIPSEIQTVTVRGVVRDSLVNAVEEAGEDPDLATRLAEIFGWDLDFYTDARRGDTFRVLVEKRITAKGEEQGYGRILAAEYDNDGRAYQAVLFHDASGMATYYSADGRSLEKAFLHSPLKFAAPITATLTSSSQTVLMRTFPNFGTDYQAPAGTPVQAIRDGSVIFAGRNGAEGKVVEIQHGDGFQSVYVHLSAVLVSAGQHVEAGGRIGLVGGTSPATGSHLGFWILDHGTYRDFETLRRYQPPTEPVASGDAIAFAAVRDRALTRLHDVSLESRTAEPDDDPSDPR